MVEVEEVVVGNQYIIHRLEKVYIELLEFLKKTDLITLQNS